MSLLLETMVGLGIFAVVILILFAVFAAVGRSNSQAREHTMARNLTREALERECSRPYALVVDVPGQVVVGNFTSNGVVSSTEFLVEVKVTELVPNERKSVVARTTWRFGNISRQVQLESFVVSI